MFVCMYMHIIFKREYKVIYLPNKGRRSIMPRCVELLLNDCRDVNVFREKESRIRLVKTPGEWITQHYNITLHITHIQYTNTTSITIARSTRLNIHVH